MRSDIRNRDRITAATRRFAALLPSVSVRAIARNAIRGPSIISFYFPVKTKFEMAFIHHLQIPTEDATGDREETKRCHNSGSGYGGLRVYTTLCPSLSSQNDTAAATPSGDTAQNDTPPDLRVHTVRTSLFCGRIDPQFRVSARFIVGFAIVLSLVWSIRLRIMPMVNPFHSECGFRRLNEGSILCSVLDYGSVYGSDIDQQFSWVATINHSVKPTPPSGYTFTYNRTVSTKQVE
ncbi:hypothetical protein R6Q59_027517 [Mikania micrantha]